MRVADPVHNVELRLNRHGQESVVFAFPYRADIVDAVRSIPGRRFDWEVKEWWAPRADATAPYVKGVLERFPALSVAPDVEAWLARAVKGWVGRVTAGKLAGEGHFVLDVISGELPEPLAAVAETAGGRAWLPFSQEVADELLEMPGARLDPRALRCASRLQVGQEPPPATLALVESVGEPRFSLDVNWDPETIPAFLALPACEAHGRSLPVDPYLLEPLEHYLRTYGVEPAANAREVLERLRREHDEAIDGVRPLARTSAPELEIEWTGWAASCARSSAPGWLRARGAARLPGRRAGPRQDRPGARHAGGRRRLPGGRRLPGVAEAQLAARDRALAAAPVGHRGVGHRRRGRGGRDHGHQLRDRPRPPGAALACAGRGRWCSTSRTTSRTRAPSARRRCASWPSRWTRTRCGWR